MYPITPSSHLTISPLARSAPSPSRYSLSMPRFRNTLPPPLYLYLSHHLSLTRSVFLILALSLIHI